MKIYINGRYLTQTMTGVQRFSYEMTKQLVKNSNFDITVLIPKNQTINLNYVANFKIKQIGFLKGHFWEQFSLPMYLFKKNNSLLINFSNSAPVFYLNKVITVHDLSIYMNHLWFSKFYYIFYRLLLPVIIRTSKRIITVSKFSKNEIVKRFKIDRNLVQVVYNGVSKSFRAKHIIKKQKNTILFVGSLNGRKNLNILLKVIVDLPNYTLNIVGISKDDFIKSYPKYNLTDNVKFHGQLYGEQLAELYRLSYIFINPSYYEGFGVPIIEAFSSKCLVLASDIDVFNEVCLDAAIFFDPDNSIELLRIINNLEQNNDLYKKMINLGLKRLKSFVWTKESNKVIKLIQNL